MRIEPICPVVSAFSPCFALAILYTFRPDAAAEVIKAVIDLQTLSTVSPYSDPSLPKALLSNPAPFRSKLLKVDPSHPNLADSSPPANPENASIAALISK